MRHRAPAHHLGYCRNSSGHADHAITSPEDEPVDSQGRSFPAPLRRMRSAREAAKDEEERAKAWAEMAAAREQTKETVSRPSIFSVSLQFADYQAIAPRAGQGVRWSESGRPARRSHGPSPGQCYPLEDGLNVGALIFPRRSSSPRSRRLHPLRPRPRPSWFEDLPFRSLFLCIR